MTKLTEQHDNITESWLCVDCGVNTAPGIPDGPTLRLHLNLFGTSETRITSNSEIYVVRNRIWQQAGMRPFGGCLCIGCLEKRIGRKLTHKDFEPNHPFNTGKVGARGTARLLDRRRNHKWQPPKVGS
jgi:hypothetical protein